VIPLTVIYLSKYHNYYHQQHHHYHHHHIMKYYHRWGLAWSFTGHGINDTPLLPPITPYYTLITPLLNPFTPLLPPYYSFITPLLPIMKYYHRWGLAWSFTGHGINDREKVHIIAICIIIVYI
jgi:hypothetical protein